MKKYKIYERMNPLDNTQVYIGVTKNSLEDRYNNDVNDAMSHLRNDLYLKPLYKLLINLKMQQLSMILTEIDVADTAKEAQELETFWIEQYRQWGFSILNVMTTTVYHGIGGGTQLICSSYDLEGNYIKTYSNIAEAANCVDRDRMVIQRVCDGTKISAAGMQWRFGSDTSNIGPARTCKLHVPIHQYGLDGTYIASYISTNQATKTLNLESVNSLITCVDYPGRQSAGFQWRSELTTSIDSFVKKTTKSTSRGVSAYDKFTGAYIGAYDTAVIALNQLGIIDGDRSAIYKCCKCKLPTYKGYIWKYSS